MTILTDLTYIQVEEKELITTFKKIKKTKLKTKESNK